MPAEVSLGFALTQHCNLRCPHCIRDDVTTVRALSVDFIVSVLDQAVQRYGTVNVGLTGGEPLLHPRFRDIVCLFAERSLVYSLVTNGWHIQRALPILEEYPPRHVYLSLSGATEAVHDAERGRGSFRRVLLAVAVLTSRRIPTRLSIVIDSRTRHQLAEAADLADTLGVNAIEYILPQPVPQSAARGSDLPLEDWLPVRREVEALAAVPWRRGRVRLAYGAPFDGEEQLCEPMRHRHLSIDARGRLVTCCQLSDYGQNEAEVVADLNVVPLATAAERQAEMIDELRASTRRRGDDSDPLDPFPCMRCARACGKLDWLRDYPDSVWGRAVSGTLSSPRVV
ncbi:MAG TPA: radical SAM protein, partial [Longimicrobiales bacterium]|nr:radical SAM protein [Longimicrobiales bacterium]